MCKKKWNLIQGEEQYSNRNYIMIKKLRVTKVNLWLKGLHVDFFAAL